MGNELGTEALKAAIESKARRADFAGMYDLYKLYALQSATCPITHDVTPSDTATIRPEVRQ